MIVCLQSGCVQFSYRFFDETLKDPATASPLLFPETVFAAPASHVAALLENTPLVYTLTGDPACFLQGLALGIQWLEEQRIEACVILAAEETNWLLAHALWHFERQTVVSGGAGAICLSLQPALSLGVELDLITDAHTYTARTNRAKAARLMRGQLAVIFGGGTALRRPRRQPASGRGRAGRVVRLDRSASEPQTHPGRRDGSRRSLAVRSRVPGNHERRMCDGLGQSGRKQPASDRGAVRARRLRHFSFVGGRLTVQHKT